MDLSKILIFSEFLNKFNQVKRKILIKGEDRLENDSEHSFQLAMLSWYIIDVNNLNFDKDLVIKYCLIHDLVEIYAWDTYTYHKDQSYKNLKSEREKLSLEKIESEFAEFEDMIGLIKKYEIKSDKESIFVYALDKMITVINNYLDWWRTWKDTNISDIIINIDLIRENKDEKIKKCPELYHLWSELIKLVEKSSTDLFLNK